MDTLEKADPTTSIRHIARFLSGTPIYNSDLQSLDLQLPEKWE